MTNPTPATQTGDTVTNPAGSARDFGIWQPIETAPRGETVLLYISNAFGHRHIKTGIAYPKNHPDLGIVSIFDDGQALGWLPEKYARHWMPLPARPDQTPRLPAIMAAVEKALAATDAMLNERGNPLRWSDFYAAIEALRAIHDETKGSTK